MNAPTPSRPFSKFDARTPADELRLLRDYPLAWVTSGHGANQVSAPHATLLPIQAKTDAHGRLVGLVGHFARHNPQVEALRRQPQAQFLFLGPHGYISPSWMADRSQAPTWNYASVRCVATVHFHDDGRRLRDEIRALVDSQEAGRTGQWGVDDMGERYERLARAIVGFEARIDDVQGKFKLGQDERTDVFEDIVRGLAAQPGGDAATLLSWMHEFNPSRSTG